MDNKKLIFDFIKKHTLAVLSTVNQEGKPGASVIEFSETDNLEIIFDTFEHFRKYENLRTNPNVALAIGWDDNITVQFYGKAVELQGNELSEYQKIHVAKLPDSAKFIKMKGIKYFKIVPERIKYSDLNFHPWRIYELSFSNS